MLVYIINVVNELIIIYYSGHCSNTVSWLGLCSHYITFDFYIADLQNNVLSDTMAVVPFVIP